MTADTASTAACPAEPSVEAPGALRVDALLTATGGLTLRARRLLGQALLVQGYLGPGQRHGELCLTPRSSAPCQICGALHDPGPGLPVQLEACAADLLARHPAQRPLGVRGWLRAIAQGVAGDGDIQAHLTGARIEVLAETPLRPLRAEAPLPRPRQAAQRHARAGRGVQADAGSRGASRLDSGAADAILRGGRIHTVCETLGTVEAVAIRGGRFSAVGSLAEIDAQAGPDTTIIDLDGRSVVPGLIDSHLHLIMLAANLRCVDLLSAGSISEVQARIAARAAETPAGDWVIASSGWHESILVEGRMPTRQELDAAAPAHPVMVPRGGHVVTANSAALAAAGIDDDTPDPPGGVIVRDPASGAATGVLLETAASLVRRVAPAPPPPARMADLLAEAMQVLNSYGLVGAVDPSVDERICEVYKLLREQGRLTVRSDLLFKARDLDETRRGIAYTLAQESDAMLRFPGLKYMLDGGVEGARLAAPYRIVPGEQPHDDYLGLLLTPPGGREELLQCYRLVAEAGLQAQTHGVGDAAIDFIAECYSEVAAEHAIGELHWCLMHVFLPTPAALARLKAAGILLTVQDHPVLLGHNQRRWWGDERADAAIPIRGLIDAGLLVGGGSDGPVVPVDPFLSMWWMVTRDTLKGRVMGPEHAITAAEALALYTINNARILGVDDERGSIEPGKRADLVVLSQDLLGVAPAAIRDTRALLTLLDGRVVFRAPDGPDPGGSH